MRCAPSTSSFSRALAAGELTQLEVLDLCAGTLGADGIVLDLHDFPRRDAEYLAQLKKLAADLALTLVAVRDDALATQDGDALAVAAILGAPYVLTRMPPAPLDAVTAYNAAIERICVAAGEAKARNVTLAVRNVAGSLAEDAFGLGRVRKEADSAWLRFALDIPALRGEFDSKIRRAAVLVYRELGEVPTDGHDPQAAQILAALGAFPASSAWRTPAKRTSSRRRLAGSQAGAPHARRLKVSSNRTRRLDAGIEDLLQQVGAARALVDVLRRHTYRIRSLCSRGFYVGPASGTYAYARRTSDGVIIARQSRP